MVPTSARERERAHRAGGVQAEFTFDRADDDAQTAIDEAYHAKYDSYGRRIVGSVVAAAAHRVTFRFVRDAAGVS